VLLLDEPLANLDPVARTLDELILTSLKASTATRRNLETAA